MKTIAILILALLCNLCLRQDSTLQAKQSWKIRIDETSLLLHSWKHAKKLVQIPPDAEITISLDYKDSITPNKIFPTSFSGNFKDVNDKTLYMMVYGEESFLLTPDGTKKEMSTSYTMNAINGGTTDGELTKIDINRITSISYSPEKPIAGVGYFIAGVSAIAALVVAPLVSINYKTGDFKQTRYYSVVGGCAIGFAVGMPLGAIFNKYKYYRIKKNLPSTDDMNYYSIGMH